MAHEILTLDEAAAHLHMDVRELLHFAQREEVPSLRRGEEYCFEHRLLDEWAQRRLLDLSQKKLSGEHLKAVQERRRNRGDDLHVCDLLTVERIHPAITAHNRGGVLRDMTDIADATGLVYDPDALFRELTAREEVASTAVGGGAAFLHAKFHDPYLVQESFIVLGRAVHPVFFGSQNGEPTDLFFLVCCTDHVQHLHVLARLCLLAHGTHLLGALREASDAETMYMTLSTMEDVFLKGLTPS